ncbi:site-specific integrase [Pseudomonas vranovensis]|uniref:site-specific integrase n=1 Tax=Pseudomonas vranovensis TaxID=321661 RepID=UPI0016121D88|nr:site-specific integrase [Pseudomonas vranovensis]
MDNSSTWASAFNFMLDVIRHVGSWTDEIRTALEARVLRLERLYAHLAPCKPRPPAPIRALPSIVIDDLYRIFNPLSIENPFRNERLRWRNYLIFLLAATMGLRRSEIAILPLDAIKSDFDPATGKECYWLNVDESHYEHEDSRSDAPSLKNSQSRRQLPISQDVLIASDNLGMGHKRSRTHSYLFESQKGKPISLRSIQRIFEIASEHLSAPAKKAILIRGNQCISAHDLRHTCAVYRLTKYMESGIDLDTATNKLRVFFGWSATSAMPRHYARAYFESESADVWTDSYDTFVTALRNIEGDH